MQSMTGCGLGRVHRNGWDITVELKTVNHRFLDIGMRLPRNISFLEQTAREVISNRVKRGHVDVFITVKNTKDSSVRIDIDQALAHQYYEAGKELSAFLGAENDLSISKLLTMEGVVSLTDIEIEQETVKIICTEAMQLAADQLVCMRQKEGEHLKQDLCHHLHHAVELRNQILCRAPYVVTEYKEKLETRLNTLLADSVDPQRLAQEVALMADRCAIDEELARLESHISQMYQYLDVEEEIGKKMDFLVQEMNRETNTIGSKAQDAETARLVVDLKSEIEKLREQIQNVE